MRNIFFLLAIVCGMSSAVHANEHGLSTIKGTQIDLKTSDHSLAGSIRDFVVWGNVDEASNSATLLMKRDGKVVQALFGKSSEGKMRGSIEHEAERGILRTEIEFVGVEPQGPQLIYKINGNEVALTISAESFANNHFHNPTYTATLNGQSVSYRFEGEACYRYSLFMGFLILGAYAH